MATRTKLLRPTEDGTNTDWYTASASHYGAIDNAVITGDTSQTGTYISVSDGQTNYQDEFLFHPSGSSGSGSTLGTSSIVTLTNIVVHMLGYSDSSDTIYVSVSVDGGSSWTATQTFTHSAITADWLSRTYTTGVSGTRNDDDLEIQVRLDTGGAQAGVTDVYVMYIVVTGTDYGLFTKILRPVTQGVNNDWTGTYADIDDVVTNPDVGGTSAYIYSEYNYNESVLLQGDVFGIYKMQSIESNIYTKNSDSDIDAEIDIDFKYNGTFTSHSTERSDYGVLPSWESTSIKSTEREVSQFGGNLEMDFENVSTYPGGSDSDPVYIYVAYAKISYRPQQPG